MDDIIKFNTDQKLTLACLLLYFNNDIDNFKAVIEYPNVVNDLIPLTYGLNMFVYKEDQILRILAQIPIYISEINSY